MEVYASLLSSKTNDLESLRSLIDDAERFVVTCHTSPDGDAMGSLLAMVGFLRRNGKRVLGVTPNIFPDFLRWMPGVEDVLVYEKNEVEGNKVINSAEIIVCLDLNEPQRLGCLENAVLSSKAKRVLIDHHLGGVDFCDWSLSNSGMSSTCELLYGVLSFLTGNGDGLTKDEATCLYTGIMTDTGCFAYSSNRSDLYHIVGSLIDIGIDKDRIYRNVFYNYSTDRLKLLGYVLYVKMEVLREYNTTIISLTRKEQRMFSHKKGDTEGFVNIPLQIKGMRLSIFLREDTERGVTRVSLRSVDDFPCNKMAAEFFNGGGHLNASGGELACDMDEALEIAKRATRHYACLLTENNYKS